MNDIFEPRNEPAKSIYLAFQDEATKRKGRSVPDWTQAELARVHSEACNHAQRLGQHAPTLEEVARAESSAKGHIDYGAKWALRVAEIMRGAKSGR
jgi:hypothetical protein